MIHKEFPSLSREKGGEKDDRVTLTEPMIRFERLLWEVGLGQESERRRV